MGLFGLPRRGREEKRDGSVGSLNNPTIPLTSDGIIAVLGGFLSSNAGVAVSEVNAMKMAVVWRCVNIIAGTIAQLPLRVYRTVKGGDREELDNGLFANPYPGMTSMEFWEQVMTHLLLWGNAYILKVPNGLGEVARLLPIPPWCVAVTRDRTANGSPYGEKRYRVANGGTPLFPPQVALTDDEIIHIPGLGYDGIRGLAPIAHARETIGLGIAAEEMASRLFGSGALMGGLLKTEQKLNQEQADGLKNRWRERITGLSRAHEIAVLDAGVTFQPIQFQPDQAQFIQSRQFSVNEICRFFGVPPHLVADVAKSTSWGTGIAEQSLGLHRYTLQHWMTRCEQRMTLHVCPPGSHAEFDADELLRGDTTARFSAYSIALHDGWMNRNEVRRKENLSSAGPELDQFAAAPVLNSPVSKLPYTKDPNGA